MSDRPKVAFICTHNSCRSQMADAIGKAMVSETFEVFSAGTEIKGEINPDAVKAIQKLYGVDMTCTQRPKLLANLPPVDIVVTMGCGVQCPMLPCKHREDWGLEDPTGKSEGEFIRTAKIIEEKIIGLKNRFSQPT
ncbi:MAG: arsenate reductase ArsC [Ethanoligenens sp.]